MTTAAKQISVTFLPEFAELFNPIWRYIIFHGGRGSGKSYQVALALVLLARAEKLRILCTREIQKTIKDSAHKLLADIIKKYGFTDYQITDKVIRNRLTGSEFIFSGLRHNIEEIKSTEGIDICWVEEAQAVSAKSWDILTPTIRKPGSRIIITFNRFDELDNVWAKFCQNPDKTTYIRHVNSDTLEKYGLLSDALRIERERDRAGDPALFAHKWLGEPMGQSENAIISRASIIEAMHRTVNDDGAIEVGVDVARMGDDRTVFYKRKGLQVVAKAVFTKLRTTEVCDKLEEFVGYDKNARIKIDDTGVGGGVTDDMIRRGYKQIAPVNFGSQSSDRDKYPNLVSEMWFYLAEIINTVGLGGLDQQLVTELASRRWVMDNRGRRCVEPKGDYKKRMAKSPDLADALILCYFNPQTAELLSLDEFLDTY